MTTDELRRLIEQEIERPHDEGRFPDDAEYRGYLDGLHWVLNLLVYDGSGVSNG